MGCYRSLLIMFCCSEAWSVSNFFPSQNGLVSVPAHARSLFFAGTARSSPRRRSTYADEMRQVVISSTVRTRFCINYNVILHGPRTEYSLNLTISTRRVGAHATASCLHKHYSRISSRNPPRSSATSGRSKTSISITRITARKHAYATADEIGMKPPKPMLVTGTVSKTQITVIAGNGTTNITFTAMVQLPTVGSAPYPSLIGIGGISLNAQALRAMGIAIGECFAFSPVLYSYSCCACIYFRQLAFSI